MWFPSLGRSQATEEITKQANDDSSNKCSNWAVLTFYYSKDFKLHGKEGVPSGQWAPSPWAIPGDMIVLQYMWSVGVPTLTAKMRILDITVINVDNQNSEGGISQKSETWWMSSKNSNVLAWGHLERWRPRERWWRALCTKPTTTGYGIHYI